MTSQRLVAEAFEVQVRREHHRKEAARLVEDTRRVGLALVRSGYSGTKAAKLLGVSHTWVNQLIRSIR